MIFSEFLENLNSNRGSVEKTMYYYMQHPFGGLTPKKLDVHVQSESLSDDIQRFDWEWLNSLVRGHLTIFDQVHPVLGFMLWVGNTGCVTPTHFDQQHVFLSQVTGTKRLFLFSPSDFKNMYPYPMRHVYDRQAQVDICKPDFHQFPNYRNATIYEVFMY
eukprot:TRINITY_DN7419_c0_g1_i1.p1 TRINITY_DN7419_c0_g1~~TRINITY_DN7419_c0_g1_i1.p1  ORF type:complete len:160 (-),score=19.28 TRINITY_DN7419_c0_g1_i1:483-962(-)